MYWNEENFVRLRRAEQYYLKLLRGRQREALRSQPIETVDPLFTSDAGPIRFAARFEPQKDKDGKEKKVGVFEPGKLDVDERAKLPEGQVDQALAIVQQLLIWLPLDTRLYWQLGELYAVRGQPGDLRAARKIFDELVWDMNVSYGDLKERRAVLNQLEIPEDNDRTLPPNFLDPKPASDDDRPAAVFDWRTLLTGFGAGLFFALFGYWQLREIRRRRQAREHK
jgi:hypothetical protein